MNIRTAGAAACVALTTCLAAAADPTHPALVYALPEDGTWVEYAWLSTSPGPPAAANGRHGILRISSVGRREVRGVPHRWVEIKMEVKDGERTERRLRKLLIDENALAAGKPLHGCVAEVYDRTADGGVARMRDDRREDFLTMGFGTGLRLTAGLAAGALETPLGKFAATEVAAAKEYKTARLEYAAWLTTDVPFGWAKFTVAQVTPSATAGYGATAAKSGGGAKSELDDTKAPHRE